MLISVGTNKNTGSERWISHRNTLLLRMGPPSPAPWLPLFFISLRNLETDLPPPPMPTGMWDKAWLGGRLPQLGEVVSMESLQGKE